jgi:hypothetical protein
VRRNSRASAEKSSMGQSPPLEPTGVDGANR